MPPCCPRPSTPDISARTFPASREFSCRTPAGWRTTGRSAPTLPRTITRDSSLAPEGKKSHHEDTKNTKWHEENQGIFRFRGVRDHCNRICGTCNCISYLASLSFLILFVFLRDLRVFAMRFRYSREIGYYRVVPE